MKSLSHDKLGALQHLLNNSMAAAGQPIQLRLSPLKYLNQTDRQTGYVI
jgi:hypothetical protein